MRIRQTQGRGLGFARGEVAIAVQPRLAGRVDAGDQRRMNAFAGRALTAPLLRAEQDHRSRRLALLQAALSAGVVQDLALAFDEDAIAPMASVDQPAPDMPLQDLLAAPRRMTLDSGFALAISGEEVVVPQALRFDVLDLPVMAPDWLLRGAPPTPTPPSADGSVLQSRRLGQSLREELLAGHGIPRVGIVVLEPVVHEKVEGADPMDQCERDLDAEVYEDQLRQDAGRLVYWAWPDEWLALPAPDAAWRNRLAYQVFVREALLGSAQAMPWHGLGVPLSLVAFNPGWQPLFADRGAVVRAGGRPRALRRVATGGDRFLWQARIEQWAEHVAEARLAGVDTPALALQLPMLPPAGLLPPDAIVARGPAGARANRFFSSQIDVFAAPVPLEQLDLLLEEAAGLAPIDSAVRDRVAVYVPVPQQVFDPQLLVIEQGDPDGVIGQALGRFVEARADWLRRRQNLREKQFLQRRALEGAAAAPVPAAGDDPLRLESEALAPGVPAPGGLLHRSALSGGLHQHFVRELGGADALPLQPGDELFAWVLLDRENPPQELMLQFDVRGWEHRAYWGENRIPWGTDGEASRRLQSAQLPVAGVWTRLRLLPAELGLDGAEITGVAFTLFGGRACFGPVGVHNAGGDTAWLTAERLGRGSRFADGESWDIVDPADAPAPFEAPLGTRVARNARELTEWAELLSDPELKALRMTPSAAAAGGADMQPIADLLDQRGLRATTTDLAQRVDQADDIIDQGFLRIQTDLYRLRQAALKQTQATRYAVSPALAQIAELDNASVTREQLADFYQVIKSDTAPVVREDAAIVRTARRAAASAIVSNVVGKSIVSEVAPASGFSAGLVGIDKSKAVTADLASQFAAGFVVGAAVPAPKPPVRGADALTGKSEIRTSSIASRMERPRSIEAKDYSVASRHDVVGKLLSLGLDLGDLELTGVAATVEGGRFTFEPKTGQPLRTGIRKLSDLRGKLGELLNDPDPSDAHRDEAGYFYSAVDLSDHTIALLRRAEGEVRRYRDVLERCRKVLDGTEQWLGQTGARMSVVERELAEARQDVATARALLAEEMERARGVNELRDQVIAEHVHFLAFARMRVAARTVAGALAAPVRELASALEPDAVPACLADHEDPPPDVRAMVDLLRRAPVDWFPALRRHLLLIDRPLVADRLIAALAPPVATTVSVQASAVMTQVSQHAAVALVRAHAEQVFQARAIAVPQAQAALTGGVTLAAKLAFIARGASVADLLAHAAERGELQRRMATEFGQIAAIAACLHARLCGVRAAIRLEWAERLSQFDRVDDLGDLSALPRWSEQSRDDREDIVELARWLRSRVDRDNPRASALMSDLLRVCVLAASHSPVGEILSGRIVDPVPLRPGLRLDVRPMLPDRVRLGMQVHLFDAGRVAARAVVEDLADGVAAVRITQTAIAGFQPGLATAVHFVNR